MLRGEARSEIANPSIDNAIVLKVNARWDATIPTVRIAITGECDGYGTSIVRWSRATLPVQCSVCAAGSRTPALKVRTQLSYIEAAQ
jgi:hypothetical protein